MEQVKLKDVLHLYLGCKVQYEGILNGKELAAEKKANKDDFFYIPKIKEIKGIKYGILKNIFTSVDGRTIRYQIGRKGLQTHYNTERFKPILRKLEDMKEEEKAETKTLWFASVEAEGKGIKMYAKMTAWYLKNHFDIFGLIKSGQAIDQSTIK